MSDPTLTDNRTLLRRTLVTIAVMVGACVLVVGTLTLVASTIVGHAIEPAQASDASGATPQNATSTPGSKLAPGNVSPVATQRK